MGRVDLHTTPKAVASAIEPMDAAKKLRLQKAAKDFEAVLVGYMLKSMRSSVQKADEFGESFGSETIEGMFDSEVARSMSRGGSFGIAEMLYKKLAGEPMPKHPAHAAASVVRPASGTTAAAVGGQRSEPAMASPPPAAASTPVAATMSAVAIVAPQTGGTVTASAPADEARTAAGNLSPVPAAVRRSEPVSAQPKPASADASFTAARAQKRSVHRRDAAPADLVAPYSSIIDTAAEEHGIDANLLKAVIATESAGRPNAVSSKNAKGLMQIIDSTAADLGITDVWDPEQNIRGGAKYLRQLLDRFDGDARLAVASYNAGPGTVERHNGVPPIRETRDYVQRVMRYLELFEQEGPTHAD